jgi:hypothetical protein
VTSAQHHIIRRKILDVAVSGTEADGFALQRRLSELCRDWLPAVLDKQLARTVPDNEHWVIDRLEIDAGAFSLNTFERDFVDAVSEGIARQIAERAAGHGGSLRSGGRAAGASSPAAAALAASENGAATDQPEDVRRRSDEETLAEAFAHFLETGTLPWWFRLPSGRTLEDVLAGSWQSAPTPSASIALALLRAAESQTARMRLVRQFTPSFLEQLLAAVAPDRAGVVRRLLAEIERLAPSVAARRDLAEQAWHAAFSDLGGSAPSAALKGSSPDLQRLAARVERFRLTVLGQLPDSQLADERRDKQRNETPARTERQPDLAEGLFVDCAGIVLLHPFLPRLFEGLGIAGDGKLVQPNRALGLLHFLATGERRAPEYALVLSKVLCGLPLDAPLAAPDDITRDEEEEATALLEAVIRHWEALGSTSVDALRGTFLVRAGKLSERGDDTVLQVEAGSFDILLDKLPWGIGAIQLPWMRKILWVEWTS